MGEATSLTHDSVHTHKQLTYCAGWCYATCLLGSSFDGTRCMGCDLCRLMFVWVDCRFSLFCCVPWWCQALVAFSVPHGESSKRLATLFPCYTRRKLQTPGNAEGHKRQETPTINPIGPTYKPHRPNTKHYRKDSPGDA